MPKTELRMQSYDAMNIAKIVRVPGQKSTGSRSRHCSSTSLKVRRKWTSRWPDLTRSPEGEDAGSGRWSRGRGGGDRYRLGRRAARLGRGRGGAVARSDGSASTAVMAGGARERAAGAGSGMPGRAAAGTGDVGRGRHDQREDATWRRAASRTCPSAQIVSGAARWKRS